MDPSRFDVFSDHIEKGFQKSEQKRSLNEFAVMPMCIVNIDDDIEICVQDNGIGMDKNTQKMVFEKFYREQNGDIHDIKGHGLGLSYVKKIVDFHKGKIMLESKKGSGTKFYINIKTLKDEIR